MMLSSSPHIRPMIATDIVRLAEIRPGFISPTVLSVEQLGSGLESGWRLVERELPEPYNKGKAYNFDAHEQTNIRRRWQQGKGLHLVVEWQARLAGVLDVAPHTWNHTAWVWNIMLDQALRGQGVGRDLFERAVQWAQENGYRALVFETQTNNVPACKFYAYMGCQLEGIRTALYSNHDIENNEVALFWVYQLNG